MTEQERRAQAYLDSEKYFAQKRQQDEDDRRLTIAVKVAMRDLEVAEGLFDKAVHAFVHQQETARHVQFLAGQVRIHKAQLKAVRDARNWGSDIKYYLSARARKA